MSEISKPKVEDVRQRASLVVDDCIRRRADGETVTDESLIGAHPDLMPELADQLRRLRVIEKVQRRFDDENTSTSRGLRIRCPHCRSPMTLGGETQLSHVVCSACGSAFGLTDDAPISHGERLERLGHFKHLDRLGVGAFGSVWSARDTELDRLVAVKIPRQRQMDAPEAEKFIREARAAAQLSHPNIVHVHEVGRDGDCLYIVTDMVQGRDLADWLTDQQATPREAAELCATLADALEHAHQRGVIHRDLKPSNIMVDAEGEPHLMDFGLAKREAGEITMTVDGKLLGTPGYMSPEQARGAAHEADQRSDIYSLGVVLYELLTGERPFRGSTRMLLHQIIVDDTPAPRKLNSRVPKDLETICLKCLEKNADRRYQTAREFADELRRFLSGEPIFARPISTVARTWRWAKRNPLVASPGMTAASLLLFLGVAGPLVAVNQAAQAERYRWRSYVSDMNVAHQAWESADVGEVVAKLKRYEPRPGQDDLRGFEWFYLWRLCRVSEASRTFPFHAPGHVAFSPDGKTLASASDDGTVKIWNLRTQEESNTLRGHSADVLHLAFSPEGKILASTGTDGNVRLWDYPIRVEQDTFEAHNLAHYSRGNTLTSWTAEGLPRVCDTSVDQANQKVRRPDTNCVAYSADGTRFATGNKDGTVEVHLFDTEEKRLLPERHNGGVHQLTFSPDGKTLASVGGPEVQHELKLWDTATGKVIASTDVFWSAYPVFSPDSKLLATINEQRPVRLYSIQLWDMTGKKLTTIIDQQEIPFFSLAFSTDGKKLVSGSVFGEITVWNISNVRATKEILVPFKGHTSTVYCLAFSPDNKRLASCGHDRTVKLWDVSTGDEMITLKGHHRGVLSVGFSPDGNTLASASADGVVKLWRAAAVEEFRTAGW